MSKGKDHKQKKRAISPRQAPSRTKRVKIDKAPPPCPTIDIDTELTALQLQDLLNFGRRQGWPTEPQYDIAHRFFQDDAAFADMILEDLSRDLEAAPSSFPLTDLRGTGYYGQYHLLLLSKEIKQRLRQLVPQASEESLARAVVQASPLIFHRLIQTDTGLSRAQAEDLLVRSRAYGYVLFPATLTAQGVRPIPTFFVPPTRATGMLALSTSSAPATSFHAEGPLPAIVQPRINLPRPLNPAPVPNLHGSIIPRVIVSDPAGPARLVRQPSAAALKLAVQPEALLQRHLQPVIRPPTSPVQHGHVAQPLQQRACGASPSAQPANHHHDLPAQHDDAAKPPTHVACRPAQPAGPPQHDDAAPRPAHVASPPAQAAGPPQHDDVAPPAQLEHAASRLAQPAELPQHVEVAKPSGQLGHAASPPAKQHEHVAKPSNAAKPPAPPTVASPAVQRKNDASLSIAKPPTEPNVARSPARRGHVASRSVAESPQQPPVASPSVQPVQPSSIVLPPAQHEPVASPSAQPLKAANLAAIPRPNLNRQHVKSPVKKGSPAKKGKDGQQDIRAFLPAAPAAVVVPPIAMADPAAAYLDDPFNMNRDWVPVRSKDHEEISSPWRLPVEWRAPGRYPVKADTRPLGQGGFGTVYHCVDRLVPGREVAKKRQLMRRGEKVANKYVRREVAALQRCQGHKGVVALNDIIWGRDGLIHYVDIILPLASASLDKIIRANREGLDELTAKTFVRQVAEGLAWIHHRGWIHLDLKPANVLVFKNYVCQITDFGLSRPTQPSMRLLQPCGTIGYRPPEELFNNHYAQESMDIWPLATIYAELRKGYTVFDQSTPVACFKSMIDTVGTKRKSVFKDLAPGYGIEGGRSFTIRDRSSRRISFLTEREMAFVYALWKLEPADRPTARAVCRNGFWDQFPLPDKSLLTLQI
ncbi:Lipopolysaccharide kinase (Kdo/WaaP) [Tilletia horrida]|nr:Lipopolysaccharide kinase (Kdo/WaaP) [Tilletia horrida]